MTCILQHPFFLYLAQSRPQVYPSRGACFGVERVSLTRYLTLTARSECLHVIQIDAKNVAESRVALPDAFLLRATQCKWSYRIYRCFSMGPLP